MHVDETYLNQIKFILDNGEQRSNRTGVDTIAVFGMQAKYDLREGFPLLTTKKVNFEFIVRELLWLISGETNIAGLGPAKSLWDKWADENGELGPVYGKQWRRWTVAKMQILDTCADKPVPLFIDQLTNVIERIKTNPACRRLIVTAWNPAELDEMALPPCHCFFHFSVTNDKRLDMLMYQRSCDYPLGVPFNIASYALLLTMMAQECGLTPGVFTHSTGDSHIYVDQIEGIKKQSERLPFPMPTVRIADKPFFEIKYEDFELVDYNHHPFIKFPVAV